MLINLLVFNLHLRLSGHECSLAQQVGDTLKKLLVFHSFIFIQVASLKVNLDKLPFFNLRWQMEKIRTCWSSYFRDRALPWFRVFFTPSPRAPYSSPYSITLLLFSATFPLTCPNREKSSIQLQNSFFQTKERSYISTSQNFYLQIVFLPGKC